MKNIEKIKAITLRKKGLSVGKIALMLGVAKSTVSLWLRDVVLSEEQKRKLHTDQFSFSVIEKRRNSRIITEEKKKEDALMRAERHIGGISKQELRILALGLYWGEGGKTQKGAVRISNSDPEIILIMMRFFREICMVDEGKFRAGIHTHSVLQAKKAEQYWSQITKIPKKQFYKTYIVHSKSSLKKRNTLEYGTLDIYVPDVSLFYEIMGQIRKIRKLLL